MFKIMNNITTLNEKIAINTDDFKSDFRKVKYIWNGFDESVVEISSNNVSLSNLDLYVRAENMKNSVVTITNAKNILFDNVKIICSHNMFTITNCKDVLFTNCVFTLKDDLRSTLFYISNSIDISFSNCRIEGGNIMFKLDSVTLGNITKCRLYNSDFLFSFTKDSKSNWTLRDNHFNGIVKMIDRTNYNDKNNLFNTGTNYFHSSDTGIKNNLNEFDMTHEQRSRDIFDTIGDIFGGGGGSSGGSTSPGSVLNKSYSIGQILTFIAIGFVLLIIIAIIIVFIFRLASKH